MLTYGIVTAGAIGSYIGGKLQSNGQNVHFVTNSGYDALQKDGLTVESATSKIKLNDIKVFKDVSDLPPCDVIIITAKATANEELFPHLKQILKPDGVVMLLQNGIGFEENIAKNIDETRIYGGVCHIKACRVAPGVVKHVANNKIEIAAFSSTEQCVAIPDNLKMIADDLEKAGISTILTDDLLTTRWKKLIINIPLNGLSVALNATNHQLFANEDNYQKMRELTKEVVCTAIACGAKITEEQALRDLENLKTIFLSCPNASSSMKDDFDNHRPMEINAIFTNPITIAKQAGICMPKTEELLKEICHRQDQRLSESKYPNTPEYSPTDRDRLFYRNPSNEIVNQPSYSSTPSSLRYLNSIRK